MDMRGDVDDSVYSQQKLGKNNVSRVLSCLSGALWSCLSRSWRCLSSTACCCFKVYKGRNYEKEKGVEERNLINEVYRSPRERKAKESWLSTLSWRRTVKQKEQDLMHL